MQVVIPCLDIVEEFVHFIPIEGTSTGEDIFKGLQTTMANVKIVFQNLIVLLQMAPQ